MIDCEMGYVEPSSDDDEKDDCPNDSIYQNPK